MIVGAFVRLSPFTQGSLLCNNEVRGKRGNMKTENKVLLILIFVVVIGAAFYAGIRYNQRHTEEAVPSVSEVVETSEPEPEPEPVYEFQPIEGEFYANEACSSLSDFKGQGEVVTTFEKGAVLPVTEVVSETSFYRLADGSFLEAGYVNFGRLMQYDTTMYTSQKCNLRSGPGTDFNKVGRYEEPGTEVHVTGLDLPTGWWQLDGDKYVHPVNIIESRIEVMDKEMYAVKKCNIRKGPGTEYEELGVYYSGTKVKVEGKDIFTGWYKTNKGYVGSSNLADAIPTLSTATKHPKTIKYEWTTWYKKKNVKWSITIDKELYEYYKGIKRKNGFKYMQDYYSDNANSYYVKLIANSIKKMGKEQGLTNDQIAQEALYFVSIIDYKTDKKSRKTDDWSKYVIETLYDDAGDCEDTSILMAGVFLELGYKVAFISLPEHCAIGIAGGKFSGTYYELDGEKYFYVETTGVGWRIGQIPDDYKKEQATLYRIN